MKAQLHPGGFSRPGISDAFLIAAGCTHVDENECARLYGFKAAGIAIPFCDLRGSPVSDGEWPFSRVRLYSPTDDQKYHQRSNSGVHVYIPPGFADAPKWGTLILVEGEFKAASLVEAGFAALGLCGLNGACRTIKDGDNRRHALNDELIDLLEFHRPARLVFLGDGDVVFNYQFAAEAAKLRGLIRGSKRFASVENVLAAKSPVDGPKGIDDCREHYGDSFKEWFEKVLTDAFDIPPKATACEVFAVFLRRECEAITTLLAADGHEASRARFKLLHSAAQLWRKPGAMLELKPLLAKVLGVKQTEIAGLIRDADGSRNRPAKNATKETAPASQSSMIEQWDRPVDGKELLDELRVTYNRFMVLPSLTDVLMAVWTLHTYLFDSFSYTPYLHVTSPEKECGKSTLAELMSCLCANATTPGGMSAAAMFRRIERIRPTLLLDEWDTLSDENRQAALNVLNTGFKWNGVYTMCVGDNHEDQDFHTFCPKAIFGLSEKKLPDTTRSRCFLLTLQKKLSSEHVDKLTRKFDGSILRRKCLRWANDHREKLKGAGPVMPPGLSAREEDISEPLLAIADACGGEWPDLMRQCVSHLFKAVQAEDSSVGVELLKDLRLAFDARDRLSSKSVKEYLNGLEDRPWRGWNEGKGITQTQIAAKLRPYGLHPRDTWLDGKNLKGYSWDQFKETFCRYLSPEPLSVRETARVPVNTERNEVLPSASNPLPRGGEKAIPAPNNAGPRGLADEKAVASEKLLAEADLL